VRPLVLRPPPPNPAGSPQKPRPELHFRTTDQIVAIGASTGGTEAIRQVLARLPPDAPGMVITQHIPRAFSAPFAARLNACSQLSVQEAQDGALIVPGQAYIAPGDLHLTVERDGARYRCRLLNHAPVNRHRPSVDVMFRSVAEQVGQNAVGVILTGMGADGARGLKEMRDRGALTIAQDEKTSVVWGMPGASVALGAVERILPIEQIADRLVAPEDDREERLAAGS
jgi:two-component system chemotaxis response regulator CheB